jgi:hypothetical protein
VEQYETDLKTRQDELRSRHYRSSHGFGRRAGTDDPSTGGGSSSPRGKKGSAPISLQVQKIELLSRNEAEMCKLLKLSPAQYLSCKGLIMREGARGPVKKSRIKQLLDMEKPRAARLFDFIERCGWIPVDKTSKNQTDEGAGGAGMGGGGLSGGDFGAGGQVAGSGQRGAFQVTAGRKGSSAGQQGGGGRAGSGGGGVAAQQQQKAKAAAALQQQQHAQQQAQQARMLYAGGGAATQQQQQQQLQLQMQMQQQRQRQQQQPAGFPGAGMPYSGGASPSAAQQQQMLLMQQQQQQRRQQQQQMLLMQQQQRGQMMQQQQRQQQGQAGQMLSSPHGTYSSARNTSADTRSLPCSVPSCV